MHHVSVGIVRDGVDVRGHLVALLALVHVNDLLRVDGQHLVRVHHHAEQAGICLRGETGGLVTTTSSMPSKSVNVPFGLCLSVNVR